VKATRIQRLRRFLEPLAAEYRRQPPAGDPLPLARGFAHPRDRELAAFIAAVCSFGPPGAARRALETLFNRLGPQPGRMLVKANHEVLGALASGLELQFLGPEAFRLLLVALRAVLRKHRSLELLYLQALGPDGRRRPLDALDRLMVELNRPLPEEERAASGVAHLLPRPAKGSATQRLHLFLRAVCRPDDGLDLGLWKHPEPRHLLLPVDASLLANAGLLKLTERQRAVRGAVLELSRTLQLLDATDPIRYHAAFLQLKRLDWDAETLRAHFRRA
jgi:uncharacterized protein (TIGR02757 family)